jgi:phosphatidylinositol N-acetylglucosaminyltransferase subunit P
MQPVHSIFGPHQAMKRVWSVPTFARSKATLRESQPDGGRSEASDAAIHTQPDVASRRVCDILDGFDGFEYFDTSGENSPQLDHWEHRNVHIEKPAALRVVHDVSGRLRGYEAPKLTEVYGFVGWLMSGLSLFMFLLWAALPESLWVGAGVTYYPSKYWALAIPAYAIMTYFFVITIHVGIGLLRTPSLASASLISDQYTREAKDFSRLARSAEANVGTPEIYDIPISVTNRLLYNKDERRSVSATANHQRYRFGRQSRPASNSIHPPSGITRVSSLPVERRLQERN